GDHVEVTSAPFQTEELPAGGGVMDVVLRWGPPVATRIAGIVFAALMLLWVVRPLVLGLAQGRPVPRADRPLLARQGAMGELAQENLAIAQQNPERAAQLVREWLLESSRGAG